MINLAVINLKGVLKKLIKIIIVTLIITMIFKFIQIIRNEKYISKLVSETESSHVGIFNSNISAYSYLNSDEQEEELSLKKILNTELAVFTAEEELMEKENKEEVINFEEPNLDNENKEEILASEIQDTPLVAPTSIIQENNKVDKYTDFYGSVQIKNESSYTLTPDMVKPDVDFSNKKDVIIYHTHTCESYTPTENYNYEATGNYRTTDLNYSVARVGTELSNILSAKGYNVKHNQTYHDYPAYTGSYTRSLNTIKNMLQEMTTAEVVFDIHRDALGNNSSYAPSIKIGDEVVAQLMFVIGTDGGGLEHGNWLKNFKLAIKIQEKANEMYPGLFKPIILRNSRYNQHVTTGASIIEVGATGNTLEQTLGSMKYLGNVIAEIMK